MHGLHSLVWLGDLRPVLSDLVFRPIWVPSGKCTTQMVTNEKQGKTELTHEKQRKTPDQQLDVSSKLVKAG